MPLTDTCPKLSLPAAGAAGLPNRNMARLKTNFFPLLASLILFGLPFFWFKNREVDFGGDSSRLYLYDPLAWLTNIALFSVNPLSAIGETLSNYSLVPYLSILVVLKKLLFSRPDVLNNFLNGMTLSGSFLVMYFILSELVKVAEKKILNVPITVASLFFVLSPLLIYDWERALYSVC